jgi:alkyldihydroxyacetonephosphate synthase
MIASDDQNLPPMKWNAWGDPGAAKPLSDGIRTLLVQALGVDAEPGSERDVDQVRLRPSALPDTDRAALVAIVGEAHCTSDDYGRLLRAGGKSTLDLLRRKDSGVQDAPDAVLLPADEDEIAAILRLCTHRSIAVVPFGGGTSVVGGLDPIRGDFKAVVSLDLRRFDELHGIDEVSGEAELGAGVTGPDAEKLLATHGFSIGHFPQSFQFATIGGFAATRSSGQDSAGYGRFDDMVRGVRAVTPAGILDLGRAPASAAGPDLRQLIIGSEGVFGVITRVRVRVHPVPESTRYEAWSFPDFPTGATALRAVAQNGTGPTVIRLSDEAETGVNLATSEAIGEQSVTGDCLAITAFEGTAAHTASRHAETRAVLEAHGGTSLGEGPAKAWEHGRFAAPYLRDSLLAAGALCETLETATNWSNLGTLKAAVTDALTTSLAGGQERSDSGHHPSEIGTPALVLCHISHVYPTGASLYFTVVAGQRGNPIEQWRKAKAAASEAMVHTGGTITHHHAVGADHRPWMRDEVGDLGVEVLRAVKSVLDPAGILNPGKLIP